MWAVLVGGYLLLGRPFSYLGISPLFIGEAYLLIQILWNRHNWLGRFVNDVARLELLSFAIFLHLAWGLVEVFRALYMHRPMIDVFRTTAFNYYPLYCLIGIMIGKEISLQTYLKIWKYIVILATVQILVEPVLNLWDSFGVEMPMPPLFTMAIICLWEYFAAWKTLYVLLAVSMLPDFFQGAHGHRSWVLGLLAGLISIAASKPKLFLKWVMISLGGFTVLMFVGPLIPGPEGSSPPLDPVVQIAHILASHDPNLAIKIVKWRHYGNEVSSIKDEEGTAVWRKAIWQGALNSLNTLELQVMGIGEGVSLQGITPDGQDIHTPHNISIYCLYYTGWIGLIIFTFLMFALLHAARQIRNPALRKQLIATILVAIVITMTGNLLEAPFGAIPFYLICGVIIGLGRREAAAKRMPQFRSYRLMDHPLEPEPSLAQPAWFSRPRTGIGRA